MHNCILYLQAKNIETGGLEIRTIFTRRIFNDH